MKSEFIKIVFNLLLLPQFVELNGIVQVKHVSFYTNPPPGIDPKYGHVVYGWYDFEDDIIYVNSDKIITKSQFKGTVAHELIHAVQWHSDVPYNESWDDQSDWHGEDFINMTYEIGKEIGFNKKQIMEFML